MRPLTFNPPYVLADYDALIASRQFSRAEAFTIYLPNGGNRYYYTDAAQTFTAPPCDGTLERVTYRADEVLISGLRFKQSAAVQRIGADPGISLEVDQQTVTFAPCPDAEFEFMPWLEAVGQGALDGATIRRDRWFFESGGPALTKPPIAGMTMFLGLMGAVDALGRSQAAVKAKSAMVLLDIQMPRNLFQPLCNHTIYDAGCTLSPFDFDASGIVGAAPSKTVIPWAGAASVFSIGKVTFETGPNAGISRTVRVATGSQLMLAYPLPNTPLAGDQFIVFQGCGRTLARCTALGNVANFRGFPFVPDPTSAF